ncbi:Glyscosyl transferase [Candidatus Sulfopaludibacter sp. SbA4]|nr:Glyscosyl transferase [Candidatus Sulfopaludibacter sp. SbA4]
MQPVAHNPIRKSPLQPASAPRRRIDASPKSNKSRVFSADAIRSDASMRRHPTLRGAINPLTVIPFQTMKILIATSVTPFVEGGATYIVDSLAQQLETRAHEVEILRFPLSEKYPELLDQLLAFRLMDLTQHGDRLISIRTPAHLLKHPRKVVWFIHHYRGAYDLWGTKYQGIPDTPEGAAYRDAIIAADNVGLREAAGLFCNSIVVRDRLKKFNDVDAEVLYPPLSDPERFYSDGGGDYLLYFARLTHHKRQWLAIESLRYTHSPVRLVIAGCPDPGEEPYVDDLRRSIEKYGLGRRVSLMSQWVTEAQKVDLFARCLGVVYFPFDEDSYGYPSLEAHAARKPVLTTTDSGGTVELVVNRRNGFVTPADPELIARAMDDLYQDQGQARRMGEAGTQRVQELGIHWDRVIARLLA